ncbi:MAG: cyclic lactone autoinducer peptide [Catonella sp.]
MKKKIFNMITYLSLFFVILGANSTCSFFIFQDKESPEIKKFRRF